MEGTREKSATPVSRPSLVAKCRDALDRAQVVIVRGPAGVGKSHLIREVLSDRAARFVTPDQAAGLAIGPEDRDRTLVLEGFDDPVRQEALAEKVLAEAPDVTIMLVTRSLASSPHQHLDGPKVAEVQIPPLSLDEARQALAGTALADETIRRLHAWSDGLPLVMSAGVDHLMSDPTWEPGIGTDPPEIGRWLRGRLMPAVVPELQYEALCAAALSRKVSAEALTEFLADADLEAVLHWLMCRGLVQSGGSGVTVAGNVLRRVILADLRTSDTWLEQSLRTRLASRAHTNASAGRIWHAADLVELIESPTIRLAWGTGDSDVRTRPAQPADAAVIGERMTAGGRGEWWRLATEFFTHAPERVTVALDIDDELLGYCIAVTPNNAPKLAHEDPIFGPRLAHARDELQTSNAIVFRDSILLSEIAGRGVRGAMHLASIMRSDARNPRYIYLSVGVDQDEELQPFLKAVAATELPALRVGCGGRDMLCYLLDLGPRGMLDASRGQILNELGQGPSPFDARGETADPGDLREEIERVIRNFHRPDVLAASPLAPEGTSDERVAQLREVVQTAVAATFGDSDREQRLREALERAYFDNTTNHDRSALEMHVSRTTYFRLVRTALGRTVDRLLESRRFGGADD